MSLYRAALARERGGEELAPIGIEEVKSEEAEGNRLLHRFDAVFAPALDGHLERQVLAVSGR